MTILIAMIAVCVIVILLRAPKDKGIVAKGYRPPTAEDLAEPASGALSLAEHLKRGNELLGQYNFDQALVHFQEALKIKNNDPSIHFKIGRIFVQKEDYKNAIAAFRNVLNLNSSQVEAYFELARIFQIQGQLDLAHQELNHALNINPEHEETLKLKAKVFEQEGKYQLALPVLKKLIGSSRHPVKYRAQIAELLLKMDKYEEAIDEYENLRHLDPENKLRYLGKIGQAHFDRGNYSKAIQAFKMVLQDQGPTYDPDYITAIRSQMAASLCNEGVRLFESGDYGTAVQRYQEALLYDDSNADIHYNLGKAHMRTKDAINAISHFEAAIELNPADVSCYYELAVLQDEKGMLKEAMDNYQKVMALDPHNIYAAFGLGTLYGVQGDLDKAIQYLSETIRLKPDYVDAIYNLGVALERKKDFNKAVQMYKKVISLDVNHDKARSNLAHIKHLKAQNV